MNTFLKKIISTGLFTGYIPFASGTFGSIIGVLIFILLFQYPFILYPLILFLTVYGVYISDWAEKYFKEKDSKKIVIDEIVGYLITMLNIRIIYPLYSLKFFIILLIGFILFRFFDIFKPLYIKKIEELKGGVGIMLDDILAGIYSNIILSLIVRYLI